MNRLYLDKFALTLIGLVALPATAFSQGAGELAGVAAAVRGDVTLVAAVPATPDRVVGRNLGSGDQIFLGDEIQTGPQSGMQIMLLDETIFTIGPDAGLVIDEFVFDPATNAGKVTASVVKGAFRFISGRVAKDEPSNMNVRTPVGTIGIRGTSAAGEIRPADPNNPASPLTGTFVLLGPGVGNNAGERAGRILVTNGDTTVEITRSGFGTVVSGPNLPPGTPVRLDPAQVAGLTAALGTDGTARPSRQSNGGQGASGQNNNGQSGNGQGSGGAQGQGGNQPQTGNSGPTPAGGPSARRGGGTSVSLGQAAALTGQNLGSGASGAGFLGQVGGTQNEANKQILQAAELANSSALTQITTFQQLRSIETGTATFDMGNIAFTATGTHANNSGGSFDADAVIDFGARTINLTIANVTYFFNGGDNELFVFDDSPGGNDPYDNDTGPVADTWVSTNTEDAPKFTTAPTDGATARITAAIRNDVGSGTIAASGFVKVEIKDSGSDTVLTGSGTANAVTNNNVNQ